MDKELILNKITTEFVIQLLEEFGSTYKRTNTDIRFIPVCHGGDKHTLIYYEDTKIFNCVTCCGFIDIFTLVQKVMGCSFKESLSYLSHRLGIGTGIGRVGFIPKRDTNLTKIINRLNLDGINFGGREPYPVTDLGYYNYCNPNVFYQGWIDEGITIPIMKQFGIRWDEYRKQIIIPCKNIARDIIGIRIRRLEQEKIDRYGKYGFLITGDFDYSFSSGCSLYGISHNLETIKQQRRCILFEGEKSVLKANSIYGNYPCVCTYGCHVSSVQIRMLQQMNVQKVILAYDADKTKDDLTRQKTIIERYGMACECICDERENYLDEKDAPIDKGQAVYEYLLKRRLK